MPTATTTCNWMVAKRISYSILCTVMIVEMNVLPITFLILCVLEGLVNLLPAMLATRIATITNERMAAK
jgi:hypothetical protein